jgi:hypothetical protein
MNETPEPPPIDYEDLERNITEAVRAAFREQAAELVISYEECLDLFFGEEE